MSTDACRLSHAVQYALAAMVRLGYGPMSRQVTRSELIEQVKLPSHFSQPIMRTLVQRGLLESARGATGGYRLARPADQITVADVIIALDGPLSCERPEVTVYLSPSGAPALQQAFANHGHYVRTRWGRLSIADLRRKR
jgi:Rrf2 family protein